MTATARNRVLTDRQLQILRLVANGYTSPDIAARLWITQHSVHSTLSLIYRNLGVHDRAHAVAVAIRLGLIQRDDIHVPDQHTEETP